MKRVYVSTVQPGDTIAWPTPDSRSIVTQSRTTRQFVYLTFDGDATAYAFAPDGTVTCVCRRATFEYPAAAHLRYAPVGG